MGWLGSGRWVGEECRGPPRRVSSRRRCAAVSRIQASTSRWDTPPAPPALITRAQGPHMAGGCFKARWRCPGVSETSVYSGTLWVFHVMLAPTRRRAFLRAAHAPATQRLGAKLLVHLWVTNPIFITRAPTRRAYGKPPYPGMCPANDSACLLHAYGLIEWP